jgi:hypothetical protein
MSIIHVGRCVGCSRFGQMHGPCNDACRRCLLRGGLRWLELARQVRSDPDFAALVYRRLPDAWRERFEMTFGVPPSSPP